MKLSFAKQDKPRNRIVLGAAVAALLPGLAQAQQAGGASGIEEILVTAQRREERLQDVPIAISAISAEQIERRRIDNVLDLKSLAPNLMVSRYPNSNVVSQVAIRGGVTVNAAMYWEPSTGMYLDGVYLGKAVGTVSARQAQDIGLVGPAARACGLVRDIRYDHPTGWYRFAQAPVAVWPTGDVLARARVCW